MKDEMAAFKGYSACKSPDVIADKMGIPVERVVKLDANENNYGASPKVARALQQYNGYHIYPDAAQTELRELLSKYTGIPAGQIVAGSGSDQLIDLLIKLCPALPCTAFTPISMGQPQSRYRATLFFILM
jgi:histidinol-phosphate aminotransferase